MKWGFMEWIAVAIGSLVSMVGLFFGARYWAAFSNLIRSQGKELNRLTVVQAQLQRRIEQIEKQYYDRTIELVETRARMDDYVSLSQHLQNRIDDLRLENERLKTRLDHLNPLP